MTAPDAAGLTCPLCGYDLRGLAEPRCPECGCRFDWDALRRRRSSEQRLLFERARRHDLVEAFWFTQWQAFRPRHLWHQLPADDGPVRPGRLVLYWGLSNLPIAVGTAVFLAIALDVVGQAHAPIGSAEFTRYFLQFGTGDTHLSPYAVFAAAAGWPPLSWAALRLLVGQRVAGGRLLRVAAYGCDVSLLLGAAEVGLFMFADADVFFRRWMDQVPAMTTAAVLVGTGAIVFRRLTFACRDHLRLERPITVALASQAIVILVLGAIAAVVSVA
jgi:hypothetical protein